MKKLNLILLGLIVSTIINAETYKMNVSNLHYKDNIAIKPVTEDNGNNPTPVSQLISKIRINPISSSGQSGWASFCDFEFELSDSSPFLFGNLISGAGGNSISFDNGVINISDHYVNSSYYYGEYLVKEHIGAATRNYWLSSGSASSSWVEFVFSPAVQIETIKYSDHCSTYNRRTDQYDMLAYDENDNLVGTHEVRTLQSTVTHTQTNVSISSFQ